MHKKEEWPLSQCVCNAFVNGLVQLYIKSSTNTAWVRTDMHMKYRYGRLSDDCMYRKVIFGSRETEEKVKEQGLWLSIKASVQDSWCTYVIWPCLCLVLLICIAEKMTLTSSTKYFVLEILGTLATDFLEMSRDIRGKRTNITCLPSLVKWDQFSHLAEEYFTDQKKVWSWSLESRTCFSFWLWQTTKQFHSLKWTWERKLLLPVPSRKYFFLSSSQGASSNLCLWTN